MWLLCEWHHRFARQDFPHKCKIWCSNLGAWHEIWHLFKWVYFGFSSNAEKIDVLWTTELVVLCCFSYSLNQYFQNVRVLNPGFLGEIYHLSLCHSYSPLSWRGQERGFGFEDFLFVSWEAVELMASHSSQFHVVQNKTNSVFLQITFLKADPQVIYRVTVMTT